MDQLQTRASTTDFATAIFSETSGRERKPLRLVLWLILSGVFSGIGFLAVGLVIGATAPDLMPGLSSGRTTEASGERLHHDILFLVLLSTSLAAAAASVLLAATIAFQRPAWSFLTPAAPFRFKLMLLGAGIFAVLVGLAIVLEPIITGEAATPPVFDRSYPLGDRLLYAGSAVFLISLAAVAEEVIFRGILVQILGAFTQRIVVLTIVSGLLFAVVHMDFEPSSFLFRVVLGAALTWTVLQLGGLEFAIGAHTANNLMVALFYGTISGSADANRTPSYALVDSLMCLALVGIVAVLTRRDRFHRWIARNSAAHGTIGPHF